MGIPEVTLSEYDSSDGSFGYCVDVRPFRGNHFTDYNNLAMELDGCWILRERAGETQKDIFEDFGVVVGSDKKDEAKRRLYHRAREKALDTVESLKPTLVDLVEQDK